jgi:hypothetical protein
MQYFLDNLNKSDEIWIDVETRNPQEIAELVAFFDARKGRYGRLDSELSEYGRFYLKTDSTEQRIAFFEDVFC